MSKIFGIDLERDDITTHDVKLAILECFYIAHCKETGVEGDIETERSYCNNLVEKMFNEIGADYKNPTRQDLEKVIDKLQDFSETFRDQNQIQENKEKIKLLIQKLPNEKEDQSE